MENKKMILKIVAKSALILLCAVGLAKIILM